VAAAMAAAAAAAAAATAPEEAVHLPPFYIHRRSFFRLGNIFYVQSYFVVSFNKQQLKQSRFNQLFPSSL
jgi:hypothetical protein